MKRIAQLVFTFVILCIGTSTAFALDAPVLTITTSNLDVTASWSSIEGATGYTLYYAPHPYLGGDTIENADMGTNTSFSVTLWDGASYYVAITASDESDESVYSNIGLFTINDDVTSACDSNNLDLCTTSSTCSNAGGYWWNDNTCNASVQDVQTPPHASSSQAQAGNCTWCHSDPRENWDTATPGDNGGSAIRPTQLACLECHITFNADNSIDIRRTSSSSVQHALPIIASGYIDNLGMCFSCHNGTTAVAVTPFHARPASLPSSNRCTASGAQGRGTFNLFHDQFNLASQEEDRSCRSLKGTYSTPATGYGYLITIPFDNASVPVFPAIGTGGSN